MTELLCGSCGDSLDSPFCPNCTDRPSHTKADSTHEMIQRYLNGFTDHGSLREVFEALNSDRNTGDVDLVNAV